MDAEGRIHLVRDGRVPVPAKKIGWAQLAQPLTTTEMRIIMGWFGGRVTASDVADGRTRSARGGCFALLDGGKP